MLIFGLVLLVLGTSASPVVEDEIPAVEPDYLDALLKEKRYEEFNFLMDIPIPHLSHPRTEEDSQVDAMYNLGLPEGDILYPSKHAEEARQGLRFDKYAGSKWQGFVPYAISSDYNSRDRQDIENAVAEWNQKVTCVKFRPRRSESAYALFFPGNGCYANLGRTGRQQPISLASRGCFRRGTILHEMDHTIGFAHEHNRHDRDNFLEVLWDNIPKDWHSQYEKTNPNDYGLQSNFDYYSVMHYGMYAPGTGKKAFRILKSGINENNIGQRVGFTDTDLEKIRIQYC